MKDIFDIKFEYVYKVIRVSFAICFPVLLLILSIYVGIPIWVSIPLYIGYCVFVVNLIDEIYRSYGQLSRYAHNVSLNRAVGMPKISPRHEAFSILASLKTLQKSWIKKEQELNNQINKNKILFNNIPDILITLDHDLNITRINKSASTMWKRNIIGHNIYDLIDSKVILDCIRLAMFEGEPKNIEAEVDQKHFAITADTYGLHGVSEQNIILMMHDITQIKNMEQTFSSFIANASHEMKTPLTTIIGILETLNDEGWKNTELNMVMLPMVIKASNRIKNLVDSLLNISKLEMGGSKDLGDIDVPSLVSDVVKQLEWSAQQNNIKLKAQFLEPIPCIIGQYDELSQVIYNLVNNSIKYGYNNSTIKVKVKVVNYEHRNDFVNSNQSVSIEVMDRSDGIPQNHISKLTDRFYNVDESRSRKLGGSGLGLSIVKQIIDKHSGNLIIRSKVGMGSIFCVYLPIQSTIPRSADT